MGFALGPLVSFMVLVPRGVVLIVLMPLGEGGRSVGS